MCGIFGSFTFGQSPISDATLKRMAGSLAHRGPDASGHFSDGICALGNTRLSVMDLSSASNQPIVSDDGNVVVVQNGEIYNFIELRNELKRAGRTFRTTGDTEVILRAYEHWGATFVTRLNGMFAIGIYDVRQRKLRLYRDRLGVKPLFLAGGADGQPFWFASEIKAILAAGFPVKPNLNALAQFFALNYVPQPTTMFQGIRHLPPGHIAEVDASQGIAISRYWDLVNVAPEPDMTVGEAKAGLLQLLDDATRIRMRSDAAFGAFLSGGLDSSSVVGFMSLYQPENLRTFSIGFDDQRFDETAYAQMAARRFGTLHQTQILSFDVTRLWPRFIWFSDQPHGDVSFIPMDRVSALATQDVKMVLTGDGGDELFAGYEKYSDFFSNGETGHIQDGWEDTYARQTGLLTDAQASTVLSGELKEAYAAGNPHAALADEIRRADRYDPINRVLSAETLTLLPGNNLVKPDRMAMANSLEVRSPFLDYRLVEFAFKVPGAMKLAGGETKAIYKQAVEPLLGRELTYRRKQMFTVPVGEWFRQSLAGYCREILLDGRLSARGIVDAARVSTMLNEHTGGLANHTRVLRALISVEIWYRLFVDCDADCLSLATAK